MIDGLKPYPAYKESGLPWLGRCPEHWVIKRGKSYMTCVDQRSKQGKEELLTVSSSRGVVPRSSTKVTMFQAATYAGHKLCWPDDLVINSLWAWGGGLGVSSHHGIISTAYSVYRCRPSAKIVPRFLHELVRSSAFNWELQVRSKGIWISRLQLTDTSFLDAPIPLPPPDEQLAIVRFLDHANRKIDGFIRAKRKLIALLNEQKQAIIHRAVTHGLNPNAPLKPSGIPWLGDIPQHWEARRLKTISPRIGVGLVINPSSYFVDDGYPNAVPILLGNNIIPNGFRLAKVRHISANDNLRLSASRLSAGDVVVVRVGAPGVAAVIPPSLDGCNCASVMIVRKHRSFIPQWLAHVFNSPVVASQIDVVKYGAAQKQFNIGHAVDFLFPVPPLDEQERIVQKIGTECAPTNTAIARTEREIALMQEYRTRLTADVVTGKLDVREAAAKLPDAEDLVPDQETAESELAEELETEQE